MKSAIAFPRDNKRPRAPSAGGAIEGALTSWGKAEHGNEKGTAAQPQAPLLSLSFQHCPPVQQRPSPTHRQLKISSHLPDPPVLLLKGVFPDCHRQPGLSIVSPCRIRISTAAAPLNTLPRPINPPRDLLLAREAIIPRNRVTDTRPKAGTTINSNSRCTCNSRAPVVVAAEQRDASLGKKCPYSVCFRG